MSERSRSIVDSRRNVAALGLALACLLALVPLVVPHGGVRAQGASPTSEPAIVRPVVVPPIEATAGKAFAALERNCASCHQAGRLGTTTPHSTFANILQLTEIASEPALVQRGNPDGSRLVHMLMSRHFSAEAAVDPATGLDPTVDDVMAVRAWIKALAPTPGCPTRKPVRLADTIAAMAKAAAAAGEEAKGLRFVSLAEIYNACATAAEMAAYRHGVVRTLASLSWNATPPKLSAIDEAGTLIAFKLTDLGWINVHWEMIVHAYPHGWWPLSPALAEVAAKVASPLPMVRGDWLAAVAGSAPLYYDLLGLPSIVSELHKVVGLDIAANIAKSAVRRAGVLSSSFSRNNRLVERQPITAGGIWMTYEVAPSGTPGRDPLLEDPLPPPASRAFRHDASLMMFSLPNGLPAFYAGSPKGERLDALPAGIARSMPGHDTPPRVGAACMSCHIKGPIAPRDELRANILGDQRYDKAVQDQVAAVHAPVDEIDRVVASDQANVAAALGRIGLDAALGHAGLEPTNALVRRRQRDLDLARLAAEVDMDAAALAALAGKAPPEIARLIRRALQGTVPRVEVDAAFAGLADLAGLTRVPQAGRGLVKADKADKAPLPADAPPELMLLADKPVLAKGDLVTFTIQSSRDCQLTVVSLDTQGRATVVLPNEFEPTSTIAAGREIRLPAYNAPYQFRVRQQGSEQLIAICNAAGTWADGITHDYEKQRFTVLGDYEAFLARALVPGAAAVPLRGPEPRGRPPRKAEPAEQGARPPPRQVGRAGIVIEVK